METQTKSRKRDRDTFLSWNDDLDRKVLDKLKDNRKNLSKGFREAAEELESITEGKVTPEKISARFYQKLRPDFVKEVKASNGVRKRIEVPQKKREIVDEEKMNLTSTSPENGGNKTESESINKVDLVEEIALELEPKDRVSLIKRLIKRLG